MCRILIAVLALALFACRPNEKSEGKSTPATTDNGFSKTKWLEKNSDGYLYRDKLLDGLIASGTLKKMDKQEVLRFLGQPDRSDKNYLFYTVAQKKIGFFPLHTKTMVIELDTVNHVKTVKIHQ